MTEPVTIAQLIAFRPGPDDVLIYECPERISVQQADMLVKQHATAFPGTRCLVLTDGIRVASMGDRWASFTDQELDAVRSMPCDDDVIGGPPERVYEVQRSMAAQAFVELERRRS